DPSIDVEKYVWDGEEWQDADSAPGPELLSGNSVQFKFVVKNTGNVPLTDVTLEDNVLDINIEPKGKTVIIGDLAANDGAEGENDEYVLEFEAPWAEGQHTNTATATGSFNQEPYTDMDDANYYGVVPTVDDPSIDVEKYVWDGEEWQDADSAPGPELLSGNSVQFKFVVKNTGNVPLTDVTLEDNVLDINIEPKGKTVIIGDLAANDGAEGENDEYVLEFEAPWAEGQHTNKATVSVYYNDILNSDEDDANYFGKVPQVFEYELSITKKADVDEYDKVGDIINYTIKVKNTGNTKLTGVTVSDPMLKNLTGPTEVVSEAGVLDVNEEWTYTGSYTIVQGDIKTDGFVKNVATADSNETGPETASVTVHYDKPSPPPENKRYRMTIDKKADVKEYSAAGDEIVYTITLKNTGNTALSDVEVTDPMLGVLTGPEGDDNNNNKLDLRETWVYEGIYIVTEADMEKDSITNTAKAESSRTDAVEDTAVVEKVEEILDEDTALGVPEVVVEDPEVPLALPDTGAFMNTSILAAIGSAFVLSGIGLGRKKRN
ncbi:MAG TPA: LPXTG cell wall anchor domain-containing protein, partial [Sedimentibacter sp.]|nr:LPXTG cell wall anchor domain-containing protein [Sedimentibacter sp.]